MRNASFPSAPCSRLRVAGRRGVFLGALLGGLLTCALRSSAAPPVISLQPQPQFVGTGMNITFQAAADNPSQSPVAFQWRRNGVDIPNALRIYTGPTATDHFDIQDVQPAQCGSYGVVVSNKDGATSSRDVPLVVRNILVLPARDAFAAAGNLPTASRAVGQGENIGATTESGEPNHGGKHGGASVWLRWIAPTTGIATFHTLGSGFD